MGLIPSQGTCGREVIDVSPIDLSLSVKSIGISLGEDLERVKGTVGGAHVVCWALGYPLYHDLTQDSQ